MGSSLIQFPAAIHRSNIHFDQVWRAATALADDCPRETAVARQSAERFGSVCPLAAFRHQLRCVSPAHEATCP